MLKHKIFILFILISTLSFTIHKYYVSLVKVTYKNKESTLQITMRIFINDLEDTLNKTSAEQIELATENESKKIDHLIKEYIDSKFQLVINDTIKNSTYLGKEYDNDVVYLYLESKNIKHILSIQIRDNMLMEQFPNQKNIIKLQINNTKKTFFLTKNNSIDKWKLYN